jgi:hypothetical protein
MKIKTTSKTTTCDPITYEATATFTANEKTYEGWYHGDENECRKEVKEGAIMELKSKMKKDGLTI